MNRSNSLWIGLVLIWSLLPMLWQLVTSFTSSDALVDAALPFAQQWTLEHYRTLLASDPPFWRYLLNSTVVGGLTTALTLLMAVPAAYGIARMSSRSRGTVRTLVAAAALFPYVLLFLALLELAREFELGNSLLAIALPYAGLALPLALLLLISAFEGLPTDLDDAARLEDSGADQPFALGAAAIDRARHRQYWNSCVSVFLERIPDRPHLAEP